MQFQEFVEDQVFSPTLVAAALRTTKSEIASTLGLGGDAFTRASRVRARKSQTRLRQMLEILNRVESVIGSPLAAYAWFRGGTTAGFWGSDGGPAGTTRKGGLRACLPRPRNGWWLRLIGNSTCATAVRARDVTL